MFLAYLRNDVEHRWNQAVRVVDDLIDFSDFLPTFAEVTGATIPARWSLDGRSFAWRLLGQDGEPRRWCYAGLRGEHWVRRSAALDRVPQSIDVSTNPGL